MSKVVMIGNFDQYSTEFVDWTELCGRIGEVWIILMDHSAGAEVSLKDRARVCRSNRSVEGVLAVVSGNYQHLVRSVDPDMVFVEPNWSLAPEVEAWAEESGYKVIHARRNHKPAKVTPLLF